MNIFNVVLLIIIQCMKLTWGVLQYALITNALIMHVTSGGGTFFKVGGHKCTSKKLLKIIFIKRFTLTIYPI